ncbi:MAG: GNAT family N-acetyltransferase, partial [Bdellovibrionaceae bacterium]|nr:GNAT family N-acetyltransferase [Pseudobdellovibrionaceae bacterium]
MNFKMEKAQLQDVEQIVQLVESVYRGEISLQGWTSEAHLLGGNRVDAAHVRDLLGDVLSAVLVYRVNGIVAGCVHLENGMHEVHLGMLAVDVR